MKYKAIKGAAHNFAHSFTSSLNYGPGNHVMTYLAHAAATSGEPELRVDLLSGAAEPAPLVTDPVRSSIARYVKWFPQFVEAMNVSVDAIHRATLRVRFDLDGHRDSIEYPGTILYPFESSVEVEDDRGKAHVGTVRGEWLGDADPERPAISTVGPSERLDDDAAQIARARRVFALQREARWRVAQSEAGERIARLRLLRTAILAHRQALYDGVWTDFRKSAPEFEITEMQLVLGEIAHTIRHLRRWMRPRRVPTPLLLTGTAGRVRYEPRGQVLVLAPWNYPFQLLFGPLVAAVAAGNVAIVRPSEKVPAAAAVMARIVAEAFPEDEVALVAGGIETADALLELPFDHVFFTGSTAVGRKVMHAAAEHMASVTLELGGKSPAIVDRSADLALAAERIVWGKMVNAGQTCVAPDYVLVHEADAPAFLAAARDTVVRFYGGGEAARMSEDFARIVDGRAFQRLADALRQTIAEGARVETGGDTDANQRYIAPTVLSNVRRDAPVMREEIFGPILPVLTVRSTDEAMAFVNARPKPLALYLFSRNRGVTERVLRGTTAGGTIVNHVICHLANPDLPFGGVGESGQGSYHGLAGFRAFSHERAVLHAGRWSLAPLYYPPYGPRMRRIANLMSRWMVRW